MNANKREIAINARSRQQRNSQHLEETYATLQYRPKSTNL